MTRWLLTLLALLTGLAAQVSPAQAAASAAGEVEIGAVEQLREAAENAALVAQVAVASRLRSMVAPRVATSFAAHPAPRVPTVLQGIDRARE